DVFLIRAVTDGLAVQGDADVLDLELTRCEEHRRAAARGDRVQVRPAVLLPRKHDAVAIGPDELVGAHDLPEHASPAGGGTDHLARLAGGHVDDAHRPGRAFAVRPEDLARGR